MSGRAAGAGERALIIHSRNVCRAFGPIYAPLSTVGTAKGAVGAARNSDNPFFQRLAVGSVETKDLGLDFRVIPGKAGLKRRFQGKILTARVAELIPVLLPQARIQRKRSALFAYRDAVIEADYEMKQLKESEDN